MDCREFEGFLYPYLDGEFEPAERTEVELHLASCRTCADRVREEGQFLESFRQRAQEAVAARERRAPDRLRQNVQLALQREHHRLHRAYLAMGAAAAIGAVVVGGAYVAAPKARQRFLEDAVLRHAKALPLEIQALPHEAFESWFLGKLDHRVSVPRLPNATVTGARLSNVKDKPAAYISYQTAAPDRAPRRMGLFVFDDPARDVEADPLPSVEVDHSHGFNVALWRDGEIVYQLVTDLDESDIRQMLQGRAAPRDPHFSIQPASLQR